MELCFSNLLLLAHLLGVMALIFKQLGGRGRLVSVSLRPAYWTWQTDLEE